MDTSVVWSQISIIQSNKSSAIQTGSAVGQELPALIKNKIKWLLVTCRGEGKLTHLVILSLTVIQKCNSCNFNFKFQISYDIGVKVACKTDFGLKFSLVFNLVYWGKYDELKRAKFQPALCTSRTCNEDYFCSMNIRFRIT